MQEDGREGDHEATRTEDGREPLDGVGVGNDAEPNPEPGREDTRGIGEGEDVPVLGLGQEVDEAEGCDKPPTHRMIQGP